jgi:hypothetical protein
VLRSPNQEGKKDGKEDNSVVNITTTDDNKYNARVIKVG